MKTVDITGQRFGRLTVLGKAGKDKRNKTLWRCLCDCGNETTALSWSLRCGDKQSCGCLNRENKSKECIKRNTIHGLRRTRLYAVWCDMRRRCNNVQDPGYKNYGSRGIRVCDEWNNDFCAFYWWAMKNGYDETAPRGKCTIDRIDVNGDYCPENCRFVDAMAQGGNKRNNKRITHNGITKTQAEWARYYGKTRSLFCGDEETVERRMTGCDKCLPCKREGGEKA